MTGIRPVGDGRACARRDLAAASPLEISTMSVAFRSSSDQRRTGEPALALESLRTGGDIFIVDPACRPHDGSRWPRVAPWLCGFHHTHRQRALDKLPIRTDWVMRLDADERLTPELLAELAQNFLRCSRT